MNKALHLIKDETLRCNSCKVLSINGVKCHKRGCPEAWRDYPSECLWCRNEFYQSHKDHRFCNLNCASSYNNTPSRD